MMPMKLESIQDIALQKGVLYFTIYFYITHLQKMISILIANINKIDNKLFERLLK